MGSYSIFGSDPEQCMGEGSYEKWGQKPRLDIYNESWDTICGTCVNDR